MESDLISTPFTAFFSFLSCLPACIIPIAGLFSLVITAFWIWMLVDVIQRDEKDFPSKGGDQKVLWILIAVLGGWIGTLVYYLVVYRAQKGK